MMEQAELEEVYISDVCIKDSSAVYFEMRDIKGWEKEVFVAFCLDTKNKVISREIISVGTLNSSVVHPREVFRTAIARNANAVIIAHNHPSGQCEPSSEDIWLTNNLKKAGEIVAIKLLDHIICTNQGYFSFADEGKI